MCDQIQKESITVYTIVFFELFASKVLNSFELPINKNRGFGWKFFVPNQNLRSDKNYLFI